MSKPKAKEVDTSEFPSVQEYIEADEKVKNLRETYPGVFEEYDEVVAERNAKLEVAEQQVRAAGVTCGPFKISTFRTTYNPQALLDAVGNDEFLQLGGSMQTVVQYDIDKKLFESFIAQNKVPQNVLDAVVKIGPTYSVPKKIV